MAYLFKRPGSQNWWLKLQYTGPLREKVGAAKRQISLGTPDRHEAELKAQDYIKQHKQLLFLARQARAFRQPKPAPKYETGEHHLPDGGRVIATPDSLIYLDAKGIFVKQEPNTTQAEITFEILPTDREYVAPLKKRDTDEAFLDTWAKDRKPDKYDESDARKAFEDFKALVNGKPISKCTRDDARKLVKFYQDQGNKDATVKKKIGLLSSAINLAVKDQKLQFNPFAGVAPDPKDSIKRLPLSENDMATIRKNIDSLRPSDQVLLRFLALTGARLSEPFAIKEEFDENGIRYVIFGNKTDQSLRRIPLPAPLLPLLPNPITGPLFTGSIGAAEKRLMRFLRGNCAITDERKVLHGLRHRAKDRLRAAGCPLDVQYQILGHEEDTVASDYGKGYPLTVITKWMEHIGE